MAVKIRLKRMGTNHKPFYRIVVADSRSPRDGRFIETLGYYNPLTDPSTIKVDPEKANLWLSRGAQPTDVVRGLFVRQGILEGSAEQQAARQAAETLAPETPAVEATEAS
ncbi:MAG: 30S ribosomal protein S16 [Armatimonadetes bacterium]|nr:30S ribosomal protein S16 [Armatimonadota bacterium]